MHGGIVMFCGWNGELCCSEKTEETGAAGSPDHVTIPGSWQGLLDQTQNIRRNWKPSTRGGTSLNLQALHTLDNALWAGQV